MDIIANRATNHVITVAAQSHQVVDILVNRGTSVEIRVAAQSQHGAYLVNGAPVEIRVAPKPTSC